MKTVIFSDVHLDVGENGARRRREFTAFLRSLAPETNRVIVLGDLFDFWFEYRHAIFSGYFEVLRAFAELRDRGVELHLICGNHDFWAGRFLRDELGFHVYHEPVTMDFNGKRVFLVHGDGLNKRDRAYRAYKRIARASAVIWAFRRIHPDRAMGIARWVSRGSRKLTSEKDPAKGAEARALRDFAREELLADKMDVILCGHSHAPAREEFPRPAGPGLYINCGDWMYHRSRVEWDGESFTLIQERVD
jgi:UDP-2,3-diacylglucosamine hydrolase